MSTIVGHAMDMASPSLARQLFVPRLLRRGLVGLRFQRVDHSHRLTAHIVAQPAQPAQPAATAAATADVWQPTVSTGRATRRPWRRKTHSRHTWSPCERRPPRLPARPPAGPPGAASPPSPHAVPPPTCSAPRQRARAAQRLLGRYAAGRRPLRARMCVHYSQLGAHVGVHGLESPGHPPAVPGHGAGTAAAVRSDVYLNGPIPPG
jgi:hypothetical protein